MNEALKRGVEAYWAGQMQEADKFYTAILKAQPKHPDANHNMGILAVSVGRLEQALPFFKTAIEVNASIEQYWISYINTLINLNQIHEVKNALNQAKVHSFKGDAFRQFEERINLQQVDGAILPSQDPPEHLVQPVIELYKKGELQQTLVKVQKLLKKFPNSVALYNLQGFAYAKVTQFDKATDSLAKVLELNPENSQAYNNMANILLRCGKPAAAMEKLYQALRINPNYAEAYNNMGNALQEKGELDEAISSYKQAIKIKSGYAEAHNNMGNVFKKQDDLNAAINNYKQALKIEPNYAEAYNNLGVSLKEKDDLNTAIDSFKQALKIKPDYAEAHSNLGVALKEKGDLDEALNSFRQAIKMNPNYAEAYSNLGIALQNKGDLNGAIESYKQALKLGHVHADVFCNMGNALLSKLDLDRAIDSYKRAIEIKPHYANAYLYMGVALAKKGNLDGATDSYRQAIKIDPDYADAYHNLGGILSERGQGPASVDCHAKAISINPNSVLFRWAFALGQLLTVYSNQDNMKKSLYRFKEELNKLQEFITAERLDEAAKVVGTLQPYYLAYFEIDNKYLLSQYGNICCRIMESWQEKYLTSPKELNSKYHGSKKIKIGIISSHIRYHSVWNAIVKGLVKTLNLQKFELHIFSLSNIVDDETRLAKTRATSFNAGEGDLVHWANKIRNSGIDIAFYAEIGMHQMTLQLASMRLAPIQVCSWGHPETSGLPTIDYYISSELLETPDSDKFYTEELIKLPSIGCYYEPLSSESAEVDFIQMGLKPNSSKLLCLGPPNKFSPDHDWVFIEIIKRLGDCQLVFVNDFKGASVILEQRLRARMTESGINFDDYVVFLPNLPSLKELSALMGCADLLLDTIGFSGFNTSAQAVRSGLPIITREGQFARTKAAGSILRTLGIEELITATEAEYIDLIEKIVLDRVWLNEIKCKIKEKENRLYMDEDVVRALEDFFERVVT